MAIGVFDSGIGGLSIHRALVEVMPRADFIYLADQKNTPYGDKPGEGLGLAIVREIAALCGGHAEIRSDRGKGFAVTV